jgi:4-amino-4-deoxy-L-arabinose transferase-like glycosyltransferase
MNVNRESRQLCRYNAAVPDRRLLAAMAAIVLLATWLRVPYVTRGMPFFYEQDEAHHFHRTVQMVKDGSFDPKYFNKPSFHFYLRMPVVAASFIAAARAGEIRRVDELVTRRFGQSGAWAFTASHPRVAMWNRAFGVALGLLVLLPVFAIARTLTGSDRLALGAMLLTAVSPALSADAAKVGVDTPLVLMCLLAMWLALRLHARFTYGRLLVAGLVAGLAISTKYNAAPIALVPLAAALVSGHRTVATVWVAAVSPIAGFVLGTPYALISLPEFLNGIAFETWHYGTAGHGYATGTPGLPQAWYYIRWLSSGAASGVIAVALAAVGAAILIFRRDPRALTMLLFPATFFALMAAQKVNFTRNVLPLIPVIAVLAVVAVAAAGPRARRWLTVFLLVAAIQPMAQAIRASRPLPPDSRLVAGRWIERAAGPRSETVVTSEVGWPRTGPGTRNITILERDGLDPLVLYMTGFDRLVARASFATSAFAGVLRQELVVSGSKADAVIPVSPEVVIYRIAEPPQAIVTDWIAGQEARVTCNPRDASGDCWLPGRVSRLELDAGEAAALGRAGVTLQAEFYTPWPNQQCALQVGQWRSADLCRDRSAAEWFAVSVDVPASDVRAERGLVVRVQEVHARPAARGRAVRTGLAVRGLVVRASAPYPLRRAG